MYYGGDQEEKLTVAEYDRIGRRVLVEGAASGARAEPLQEDGTVRKALDHSKPPGYRRSEEVARPVIDPVRAIIDAWIEADKDAPRKQRHTAKRIWCRLRDEHGFRGGCVWATDSWVKPRSASGG